MLFYITFSFFYDLNSFCRLLLYDTPIFPGSPWMFPSLCQLPAISSRVLVSFSSEWHLETKIQEVDSLIVFEVSHVVQGFAISCAKQMPYTLSLWPVLVKYIWINILNPVRKNMDKTFRIENISFQNEIKVISKEYILI